MSSILVAYATTEGQTRKIARTVADQLSKLCERVHLVDLADMPDDLDVGEYDAFIIAASLHVGHYQPAVRRFAKRHAATLSARSSAFISVSLSAAAEEPEHEFDAHKCVDRFIAETGWRPMTVHHAAGALKYSEYDFFKRWVMRRIAKSQGYDADEDMEFTDWGALSAYVDDFARAHFAAEAAT